MYCWEILGIEETDNVAKIKKAYAKMAKKCRMEDEQHNLLQVNKAYEMAMSIASGKRPGAGNIPISDKMPGFAGVPIAEKKQMPKAEKESFWGKKVGIFNDFIEIGRDIWEDMEDGRPRSRDEIWGQVTSYIQSIPQAEREKIPGIHAIEKSMGDKDIYITRRERKQAEDSAWEIFRKLNPSNSSLKPSLRRNLLILFAAFFLFVLVICIILRQLPN